MNSQQTKFASHCQRLLVTEFKARQERNSSYSLRAFARDIGVSKTSISDVINGLRCLSLISIESVAVSLKLDEEQIKLLRDDLSILSDRNRNVLLDDEFVLIKDWYYIAILNLAKLSVNHCNAEWVADRLGLDLDLAEESLEKLIELKLIKNVDGRIVRTSEPITTTADIPSASIREHHKQSLQKAIDSLESVPVELRDYTTVTYAIHPDNISEVKKIIHGFHRKLGKVFSDTNATDVYRLNIQFFPLTKPQVQEN